MGRELVPTLLAALKEQTSLLAATKSLSVLHISIVFFQRPCALHSPQSSHKLSHGIFHNNQVVISVMIVSFDNEQNSSHVHTALA